MILTTKEAQVLDALRSNPELVLPTCYSTNRMGSLTFANLTTLDSLRDKGFIKVSAKWTGTYNPLGLRYELTDLGRALLTQSIVLTGVMLVGLREKAARDE